MIAVLVVREKVPAGNVIGTGVALLPLANVTVPVLVIPVSVIELPGSKRDSGIGGEWRPVAAGIVMIAATLVLTVSVPGVPEGNVSVVLLTVVADRGGDRVLQGDGAAGACRGDGGAGNTGW